MGGALFFGGCFVFLGGALFLGVLCFSGCFVLGVLCFSGGVLCFLYSVTDVYRRRHSSVVIKKLCLLASCDLSSLLY